MGFTTPKAPVPFEHDGITFMVRGLSGEEFTRATAHAAHYAEQDNQHMAVISLWSEAIRGGLVGWEPGPDVPKWTPNIEHNVSLLDEPTYAAVAQKVLELSGLGVAEAGNSDSHLNAPNSSAADKSAIANTNDAATNGLLTTAEILPAAQSRTSGQIQSTGLYGTASTSEVSTLSTVGG